MSQVNSKKEKVDFNARKFIAFLEDNAGGTVRDRSGIEVQKASRRERQALVNSVAPKIEAVTKNSGIWALCALEEVRQISRKFAGREMLTEQIRQIAEPKIGPAPNDGRAWGGVIQKAAKLGYLTSDGRWSPAKTSHGGPKVLWTLSGEQSRGFMTDSQKEQARRFVKMNLARADLY